MALDAALNSIAALEALSEALDAHDAIRHGILGVMGAVGAARVMIAEGIGGQQAEDGECLHENVAERRVGAGLVKFCHSCGEMLP